MNRSHFALALAVAAVALSTAAFAQGRNLRGPAELPPTSFEGVQFVDSRGCAFVRAGISGDVVWVPRVNRDRSQICNQPPTFGSTSTRVAAAPVAPPAAPALIEPPRRPAAGAPIETVASRAMPVTAPAPRTAPEGAQLTMAQVCQGRSGILPDFRTGTGGPVDCGPGTASGTAPMTVSAAAPAPPAPSATVTAERPRLTLADVCEGRSGPLPGYVNAATGQPVSCGEAPPAVIAAAEVAPSAPAPVLTLAQVCQGHQGLLPGYRTQTGGPVICGGTPAAPAPVLASASCPPGVVGGVAYRCGGAQIDPLSSGTLSLAGIARTLDAPRSVSRAPFSNPAPAVEAITPPAGYAPVWDDGRVNPNRGLTSTPAVVTRAPAPQSVTAAPAATPGHRFVQIGTYGDAGNAERAVATLRALGLPASTQAITRNGRSLTVVAAGPFAGAGAAQAALQTARNAGYSDAFTRG